MNGSLRQIVVATTGTITNRFQIKPREMLSLSVYGSFSVYRTAVRGTGLCGSLVNGRDMSVADKLCVTLSKSVA